MSEKKQLIRDLIGAENIEKVKRLLKFDTTPIDQAIPPAPLDAPLDIVFTEAKLKNGTVVKSEGALAEGSKLTVVTPEGEQPAPDGSHELEDGTIVTVVGGLITKVEAAQIAPVNEEAMNEIKADITAMKAQFKKESDILKADLLKAQTFSKELFVLVEKILDAPSGEAIEKPKQSFNKMSDLKKDIEEFRKSLKK